MENKNMKKKEIKDAIKGFLSFWVMTSMYGSIVYFGIVITDYIFNTNMSSYEGVGVIIGLYAVVDQRLDKIEKKLK